jgi:hypothetical protein
VDGKYSDDKDDTACKDNSVIECPPDWGLLPSSKMKDDAVCERCEKGWFSSALDASRCISQAEIDKAAADAKAPAKAAAKADEDKDDKVALGTPEASYADKAASLKAVLDTVAEQRRFE